jgi:hypothetical protein
MVTGPIDSDIQQTKESTLALAWAMVPSKLNRPIFSNGPTLKGGITRQKNRPNGFVPYVIYLLCSKLIVENECPDQGKPFHALSTVSSVQRTSGMFEGIP